MNNKLNTYTIKLNRPSEKLPHCWKKCVGSGHALLGLREDWRTHLKKCKQNLGFEYVRFHGLLNDDMGVYKKTGGTEQFNFFNIRSFRVVGITKGLNYLA